MYQTLYEEALQGSDSQCKILPAGLGEAIGDFAALSVADCKVQWEGGSYGESGLPDCEESAQKAQPNQAAQRFVLKRRQSVRVLDVF